MVGKAAADRRSTAVLLWAAAEVGRSFFGGASGWRVNQPSSMPLCGLVYVLKKGENSFNQTHLTNRNIKFSKNQQKHAE